MKKLLLWALALACTILPIATSFAQPPDTLWTRQWDTGLSYEKFECISALPAGGYIASGFAWEGFDIQVATARLDNDGNVIWMNLEGENGTDGGHYIDPTSDGGFIQCGESRSVTGGPHVEAFVRKLDGDGNQEWARLYGTPDTQDYLTCVREAPEGGYIAVGWTDGRDLWRISESGETIWHRTMPEFLHTTVTPDWVEPTADGGFIVPNQYYNNDVETGVFVLIKVNRLGELEWYNDEALPDQDPPTGRGYCVREDDQGYLYTCGALWIPANDPQMTGYVSKRNTDGSLIWTQMFADPLRVGFELILLPDGSVAVGGYHYTIEGLSLWLAKLSSDGEVLWEYEQLGGDISSLTQGQDGSIVAS